MMNRIICHIRVVIHWDGFFFSAFFCFISSFTFFCSFLLHQVINLAVKLPCHLCERLSARIPFLSAFQSADYRLCKPCLFRKSVHWNSFCSAQPSDVFTDCHTSFTFLSLACKRLLWYDCDTERLIIVYYRFSIVSTHFYHFSIVCKLAQKRWCFFVYNR